MSEKFLPGTLRERIQDLCKSRKITQAELAAEIGLSESALSRFLSGATDKLGNEYIVRAAKYFAVSTDFLLGIVDDPERKNYDISELGLSVQAAKNLYSGKVNAAAVNRLLENERFAKLTYLLSQYWNDVFSSGIAAQNEIYSTVGRMLGREELTEGLRTPIYPADTSMIETSFMAAVKEIKKESESKIPETKKLTREITANIFEELQKGRDTKTVSVTPGDLSDAIVGTVSKTEQLTPETLEKLRKTYKEIFSAFAADE